MILRPGLLRNDCEEMGLAPTRSGEAPGESAVAKVPVPMFSQPRSGTGLEPPPRRRSWWWAVRRLAFGTAAERRLIRYRLAEIAARAIGGCWVPEDLKLWQQDQAFWRDYRRVAGRNLRSAERKYAVRELVRSLADVPGDTAECGVFEGATSFFICQARGGGTHHAFDSFAGLSRPSIEDEPDVPTVAAWRAGDLCRSETIARRNLASFPQVRFYPGWIPERFGEVASCRFSFVHIDVDLYQPTRDSLEFFYPRMSPGGMIVCDDYGYVNCPGAKQACDELAADWPEPWIHLPTGQGLLIKQTADTVGECRWRKQPD
jgi:O-methyltransferase